MKSRFMKTLSSRDDARGWGGGDERMRVVRWWVVGMFMGESGSGRKL